MKKLLLFLLMFCSALAFGQGAALPFAGVTGPNGQPVPFVTITFCNTPATVTNGVCAPAVTVYQNITLTTPYSSAIRTDGLGNFPVVYFSPAANMCYSLSGFPAATNTCYPFSVPIVPGANVVLGNLTLTSLTVTGGSTQPQIDNRIYVDGSKYPS